MKKKESHNATINTTMNSTMDKGHQSTQNNGP